MCTAVVEQHNFFRVFQNRRFPLWANVNAIILSQGQGYLHHHLNEKVENVG